MNLTFKTKKMKTKQNTLSGSKLLIAILMALMSSHLSSQTTYANGYIRIMGENVIVSSDLNSTPNINQDYVGDYDLIVKGGVLTSDIGIYPPGFWADYVFEKNYPLMNFNELRAFIKEHKHLPNVPSESVIKSEGYTVQKMNVILLEKIEELHLYILQLEKRLSYLEKD